MSMTPRRYGPLPDVPITRRPKLTWPDGARVALCSVQPGAPNRCSETRLRRKWDQRFESSFLQQAVCLSGERRGCTGKAPHFGGILRVAGDVRRDVQAANRASFALSL
jgi:hypothetical protein